MSLQYNIRVYPICPTIKQKPLNSGLLVRFLYTQHGQKKSHTTITSNDITLDPCHNG